MNYQNYIKKAEFSWIKRQHKEAIEYYKLALNCSQSGRITKKSIIENIKEIENQLIKKNGRT